MSHPAQPQHASALSRRLDLILANPLFALLSAASQAQAEAERARLEAQPVLEAHELIALERFIVGLELALDHAAERAA